MADELDKLGVSEEKKRYIMGQLNPLLDEMMAECIRRTPHDPVPFMLDWLETKKVSEEEQELSKDEKDRLAEENRDLQSELAKAKSHLQEAAKAAASGETIPEDDEEEDDEDTEPPPGFGEDLGSKGKARASVSAEAYGEWNTKKAFVAPVIIKTQEQKERLKTTLSKSFLFKPLEDNDFEIVIGAMKEVKVKAKEQVIKQGDSGDFLFVIESGKLECKINDRVVKTVEAGDVFGELALLYNCPRAASVFSTMDGVLWQLDRETFNYIVKEAVQKKRARYDAFLARVPLLASVDAYERSQLADALLIETFSDGEVIMTQGEKGKKFYIIEEGEVLVLKSGQQVSQYGVGDYFGELALIRNQPRAATVTAKGFAKVLVLDRGPFQRLLNVSDLLERATQYA